MNRLLGLGLVAALVAVSVGNGFAADDSKVKSATDQVEGGAKKIGEGKVGTGVEETAKGVGNTVVEGAKSNSFGSSVKSFVTRLFSK
jgi:hypothetical protein